MRRPDYPLPAYADGVVYEPISKREYTQMARKEAEQVLERAMTKARAAGVDSASACIRSRRPRGKPSSRPPKIEMRCHRDGLARPQRLSAMLLGSETQKVLTHSKLPVLVVR